MDENWFKNKSLWSKFRNAYLKDINFKKFWIKFDKKNLDKDLIQLINFYVFSDSYKSSSRFWNVLNIRHVNQISEFGIDNFATSVALHYFTTIVCKEEQIKNIINHLENKKIDLSKSTDHIFKRQINLDFTHSANHNIVLNLLHAYLKTKEEYKYLKLLDKNNFLIEKIPYIEIEGLKITQDKINSILEFININKIIDNVKSESINILEIGAGSGRTTETVISLLSEKKVKYVIVDIPPALHINYLRMKNNYPNNKIKVALDINSSAHLNEMFKNNDILLILPHQLKYFENKNFDLTIAIDCLHEMDKKTIKSYMDKIDRVSNYFYYKVWSETHVPYSFKNFLSAKDKKSYFIKDKWELLFEKNCIFPSNYYEFGYRVI